MPSHLAPFSPFRFSPTQQSVEKYFTEITDTVRVLDELQSGLSMAKEFEMVLAETGKLLKHRSTHCATPKSRGAIVKILDLHNPRSPAVPPPVSVCNRVFPAFLTLPSSRRFLIQRKHSNSALSRRLSLSHPSLCPSLQTSPSPSWSPTRSRRRAVARARPRRSPRNFRGTCLVPT